MIQQLEPKPSDFRKIAWGMLVIGVLVFLLTSAMAVDHYFFGMPMYEGRGSFRHLASPTSIAEGFVAMGAGSGFFAVFGWLLIWLKPWG